MHRTRGAHPDDDTEIDAETLVRSVGVLVRLLALVVEDVAVTRVVTVDVGGVLVALAYVDERVVVVVRVLHAPATSHLPTRSRLTCISRGPSARFVCIAHSHAGWRKRVRNWRWYDRWACLLCYKLNSKSEYKNRKDQVVHFDEGKT